MGWLKGGGSEASEETRLFFSPCVERRRRMIYDAPAFRAFSASRQERVKGCLRSLQRLLRTSIGIKRIG